MSKQRRQPIEARASLAAALADDPSESGPPSADESSEIQGDSDGSESPATDTAGDPGDGQAQPAASAAAEEISPQQSPQPCPDLFTIIAGLDRREPAVWPTESRLTVEWPHSGEIDPQPGDIVGWNWITSEVAVVTGVPPVTEPWPYRLTVEIRPMPFRCQRVKVYDLTTGARLEVFWYTRWNRAYEEREKGREGERETPEVSPAPRPPFPPASAIGSGWLAVVEEQV